MGPGARAAGRALLRARRLVNLAADRPPEVPLYWQQWKLDSAAPAAVAEVVVAAAGDALGTAAPRA